jgi:DNA-binding phage protein
MTKTELEAKIKMYLDAYRETGNKKFLARALKLSEIK